MRPDARRRTRGGNGISGGICFASAVALIAGAIAIHDEYRVARAQSRLLADGRSAHGAGRGSAWPIEAGLPPRAGVIEAVRTATAAAREPYATRRSAMLDDAAATARSAAARRPRWADAEIAQAYIAAQRGGAITAPAIAALRASYEDAPFVRDAGGWRVAAGLSAWGRLDDRTRRHVVDEAAWLAQTSYRSMLDVVAMMRGTPAYQPFILRWRALRMSDATA